MYLTRHGVVMGFENMYHGQTVIVPVVTSKQYCCTVLHFRSKWFHPINKKHKVFGEYNLMCDLELEDVRFKT